MVIPSQWGIPSQWTHQTGQNNLTSLAIRKDQAPLCLPGTHVSVLQLHSCTHLGAPGQTLRPQMGAAGHLPWHGLGRRGSADSPRGALLLRRVDAQRGQLGFWALCHQLSHPAPFMKPKVTSPGTGPLPPPPTLRPPQGVQCFGLTGPHARLSGLKSASSQPPAPAGPAQAGFLTPTCSLRAPQPRLPDPLSWRPVLPTPGNRLFKRRREGQRELSTFQTQAGNTPSGTCA